MSLDSRSLMLVPAASGGERCSVAVRSDLVVASSSDNLGPGRLLNHGYQVAGQYVERKLNRFARVVGRGPEAAANRIETAFGADVHLRQSRLDDLYDSVNGRTCKSDSFIRQLGKDSRRLMRYARP